MHPLTALLAGALAFAAAASAQQHFPLPVDPAGNPTTPAKALLGKALFWDEQMSASRTMACGTCHVLNHGGTDPRATGATHPGPDGVSGTPDDIHGSRGIVRQDAAGAYTSSALFGIRTQSSARRSPSVINAAYEGRLFWDGRADGVFTDPVTNTVLLASGAALESQAAGPPVNDVEMSHIGRSWTDIATDIANRTPLALAEDIPASLQAFIAGQTYATLFQQVYGSPGVTPARIIFAIAAYERTLISDQTPFDDYLAGNRSLTAQQQRGLDAFTIYCITCHADLQPGMHASGPALNDFRRTGLRPDGDDPGRSAVTGNPSDLGRFKTPQLRNVALRAPYMHNGGMSSLGEVIDFYNRGGDFGPNIDPSILWCAGRITPQMRTDLIVLLQMLTDPRVGHGLPPFDRPRLYSESGRVPVAYGTGTAGTGGFVPAVQVAAPPYLGNAKFMLGVDQVLPAAPALLVLDLFGTLLPTPVLGHNYYLTPFAAVQFAGSALPAGGGPAGSGYATQRLPIPANPVLAGTPLYGQWLLLDAAGPFGMASSNAFTLSLF